MKIKEIMFGLALTTLSVSTPIMADADPLEEARVDKALYGIVDAIYPEESRVVIDDMSIQYNDQSDFKNLFGRKLSGSEKKLKTGTAVKYQIGNRGKSSFIEKLEVISKRKYKYETTRQHADNY